MKAAKYFLGCLMGFLLGCSNGGPSADYDMITVDPSLELGPEAEIYNAALANYALGIMYSSEEGKLAVVVNRLIIDPVDETILNEILQKYHAVVVEDANIPVPEDTILDTDGAHSGGTTYRLIEFDPNLGKKGYYAEYLRHQGASINLLVDSPETEGFLNILGQMYLEDSGKLRDIQAVVYASESPVSLLQDMQFPLNDWATCRCLWREGGTGSLKLKDGATWHEEIREAPIYNSLITDRTISPPRYCTYNDGLEAAGDKFLSQGDNVLIANFATFYSNHEKNSGRIQTGPEGNMHLWAFPASLLPIHLPSQLKDSPPGAVHINIKGPSDNCEWWPSDVDQYIAYQNVILWDWDRAPNDDVALFLWEGDECFIKFFAIRMCNPDDKIAMFKVARNRTTSPNGLLLRDIDYASNGVDIWDMSSERDLDLRMQTIDYCRAKDETIVEICNGYDDTCDGKIDEGFEAKGTICDNGGVGQCHSMGSFVCENPEKQRLGEPPLICNAPPRQPSTFEICDGVDNDCDGQIDENWIQEGLACGLATGTCGVGSLGCTNGHISCEGEIAPIAEICDGLDNDCDGVTDEGCNCTPGESRACSIDIGPCTLGIQDCLPGGNWSSSCSGTIPQPEICDGIDNNCNGSMDEGVLNNCGNCGPEPTEICDGIDNDCDGSVDEGVTNACGGCWIVGPEEYASGTDDCDGIDNDCDGIIDEYDVPVTCGQGVCQVSVDSVCQTCVSELPELDQESFQNDTCNNGVDDDCDGSADFNDLPDCLQLQGGGG